jgi:hypothetical protein
VITESQEEGTEKEEARQILDLPGKQTAQEAIRNESTATKKKCS